MARIIIHTGKRPYIIENKIHLCMCGLSDRYPFCDGSHKATHDEEEDSLYIYDSQKQRILKMSLKDLRKV